MDISRDWNLPWTSRGGTASLCFLSETFSEEIRISLVLSDFVVKAVWYFEETTTTGLSSVLNTH